MNLKNKIKNIIENEEWYQDIIDTVKKNIEDIELVKVIDEGQYYPTYLDAMYFLNITGLDAKKYVEIENFRKDVSFYDGENFLYRSLPVLDRPEMGDVCYLFGGKSFNNYIYKLKRVSDGKEFIMSEEGFTYLENKKNIKENYDWITDIISNNPFLPNKLYFIRSHKILIKIVNAFKEDKKINDPLDDGWRVTFRAFNYVPKEWEPEENIDWYWAKKLIKQGHWEPISEENAEEIFGHMYGYHEF